MECPLADEPPDRDDAPSDACRRRAGRVVLIHWLARLRRVLESPSAPRRVGLLLRLFMWIVLLHLIQVGLWAIVFWRARKLPNFETALYFSLVTYTTIGFDDVVVGPGWRVLVGDRRPHRDPARRLVDGVRLRGRESDVRALAAGARRVVTRALERSPRRHTCRGRPRW